MDDQFLHRLRRDPSAAFAIRLKRQLDRPAPMRPTRTHLILGVAIFGTAFALTSPPVRHAVTHWFTVPTGPPPHAQEPHRDDSTVTAESSGPVAGVRTTPHPVQRSLPSLPVIPPPPAAAAPAAAAPPSVTEAAPVPVTPSPVVSSATTATAALLTTSEQRAQAAALTRQGLFRLLGWIMQPLYAMARGQVQFDEQRVALSADRLQQLSSLIPEVFRSDTHLAEVLTEATPNIWTQLADFDAKADTLTDAADALERAAAEHDREAAIKALVQVSAACNACHIAYTNIRK